MNRYNNDNNKIEKECAQESNTTRRIRAFLFLILILLLLPSLEAYLIWILAKGKIIYAFLHP